MMMKNLFLFFTAVMISMMIGCDPSCSMDFVIINETESDIVIEMRQGSKQVTIEPGQEQIIDRQSGTCVIYKEDATMIHYADMQIEGMIMPKTIWISRYWDCVVDNPLTTYTLTITDKLIETILSEVEEESE